jgi:hypothetical protein
MFKTLPQFAFRRTRRVGFDTLVVNCSRATCVVLRGFRLGFGAGLGSNQNTSKNPAATGTAGRKVSNSHAHKLTHRRVQHSGPRPVKRLAVDSLARQPGNPPGGLVIVNREHAALQ